jgi:hypothetical protein
MTGWDKQWIRQWVLSLGERVVGADEERGDDSVEVTAEELAKRCPLGCDGAEKLAYLRGLTCGRTTRVLRDKLARSRQAAAV